MDNKENTLLQGKYEIVSKIKQGGFGIVYYGFDRVFEKPIAIKAIDPALLEDAKYVDLFLAEAKNAAKLSHNNIVRIYDLVKNDDGQFFIIMEFIEGHDLAKILRKCKEKNVILPIDLSVYIVKEVCKALEYAHNKRNVITNKPLKLVHQDISPSNLMISFSGQVKLIDFGLAKLRIRHSKSDEVVLSGKLPYLTPEQINGGNVDRRTDIFSLGVTFYEMLTNTRLVDSKDPKQVIQQIKKSKVDVSVLEEHDVPETIQKVLLKMLQKNQEDRYFGANGVYLDLVEFLMQNTHSVELSDELGEYIRELYNHDNSGVQKTISTAPKAQEPQQADTQSDPESIEILEKKDITEEPLIKTEKDKSQEKQLKKADPGKSDDPSANLTRASTIEKINFKNELDKILNDIESNFSRADQKKADKGETVKLGNPDARKDTTSQQRVIEPPKSQSQEELADDDLKTVIDVIRLSTRNHSKKIKLSLLGLFLLIVGLFTVDFFFQFSPIGIAAYNRIFPPAIKIDTVPSGAIAYLDGKRLPQKTPLNIPEIEPGVHQLTLTHAGFNPLIKSLRVPAKGEIKIEKAKYSKLPRHYLFNFKATVELNSHPSGSVVLLNGVRLPQKTPTNIDWLAGKPLSIEMAYEGFERISGFQLDLLNETSTIDDHRLWDYELIEGKVKRFVVEGKFKKFLTFNTIPAEVTYFIDGAAEPSGRTGISNAVPLSMGKHEIRFEKEGLNDKIVHLNINEESPETINIIMDRPVQFYSKAKGAPDSTDLNSRIVRYMLNGKSYAVNKTTPCKISLPVGDVSVFLSKENYHTTQVNVTPDAEQILAVLESAGVEVEIFVRDALTDLPIKQAEILFESEANQETEKVNFGITNDEGKCSSRVSPGKYNFSVAKDGYYAKQLALDTEKQERQLEFKLIIQ